MGWTFGVYGLVFDASGKVLLVHRRDKDIWQSPGGGVQVGETPSAAVIREIREESGLTVIVERLIGVYVAVPRKDIILSFLCTVTGGAVEINDEADAVEFFEPENLPQVTPATLKRVKDYSASPDKISWSEDLE